MALTVRKLKTFLLAAATLTAVLCSATARAEFFTTQELHESLLLHPKVDNNDSAVHASVAFGYVLGVFDSSGDGLLFCAPKGVTAGQIRAVVSRYLASNPGRWDRPATTEVVSAFQQAWPCQQPKR